jgi:hypothetical protein
MNFPRTNKGFSNYLTFKLNLIYFTLLCCRTFLNPTNRVGLIKLQGSDEFHMNFGISDLNLELNINHWKLRKSNAHIGLNLARPKASWAWLQNTEQGRQWCQGSPGRRLPIPVSGNVGRWGKRPRSKLGGWGNHFGRRGGRALTVVCSR